LNATASVSGVGKSVELRHRYVLPAPQIAAVDGVTDGDIVQVTVRDDAP